MNRYKKDEIALECTKSAHELKGKNKAIQKIIGKNLKMEPPRFLP